MRILTEIETIKNCGAEKYILELNKIKSAIESINSRMDQAKQRICALEDRNFEIIHSENRGKN